MSRDAMRHARNSLDLEHGLGLGAQRDGSSYPLISPYSPHILSHNILEGVFDAMLLKQAEEIGRVLVYYDVLPGDMDSEAVRGEVFTVLAMETLNVSLI